MNPPQRRHRANVVAFAKCPGIPFVTKQPMFPSSKLCRPRKSHTASATLATDEISTIITDQLDLGNVTSMSRDGSSGWAVMHRATTDSGHRYFIKVSREHVSMFEGEAAGLSAMHATKTIHVPQVVHCGSLQSVQGSYIIMDALELLPVFSYTKMGEQLAKMHLAEPVQQEAKDGKFGFSVDNTIGATPQPNGWMDDWVAFFRERRLRHQLLLTGDEELMELGNVLVKRLDELFVDIEGTIKPSILHGDLWSGNIAGMNSEPVIFDPASYYGHNEADFGMSWCAGFSPAFWEGYHSIIPKTEGFEKRHKLYQLYHYLNHYNLFGGGYFGMSRMLLKELVEGLK